MLVRWLGEYPDEWKGKGELSQEAKRAVVKWERQAFGVRAIEAPERVDFLSKIEIVMTCASSSVTRAFTRSGR